jgi:hypothetical protein
MSWDSDVEAFTRRTKKRTRDVFNGCTKEAFRSIVTGSEVTAAPGQPFDTGVLRASWRGEETGPLQWRAWTPMSYAPTIEDKPFDKAGDPNDLPSRGKSTIGGKFSVQYTVNAWKFIVDHVLREVAPGG